LVAVLELDEVCALEKGRQAVEVDLRVLADAGVVVTLSATEIPSQEDRADVPDDLVGLRLAVEVELRGRAVLLLCSVRI